MTKWKAYSAWTLLEIEWIWIRCDQAHLSESKSSSNSPTLMSRNRKRTQQWQSKVGCVTQKICRSLRKCCTRRRSSESYSSHRRFKRNPKKCLTTATLKRLRAQWVRKSSSCAPQLCNHYLQTQQRNASQINSKSCLLSNVETKAQRNADDESDDKVYNFSTTD